MSRSGEMSERAAGSDAGQVVAGFVCGEIVRTWRGSCRSSYARAQRIAMRSTNDFGFRLWDGLCTAFAEKPMNSVRPG